ncbi:unnamed protein product, partial [Closterium sp. NIES-54]
SLSYLLVTVTLLTLKTLRLTGLLRGTVSTWVLELFPGGPRAPLRSRPLQLRLRSTLVPWWHRSCVG